jgi:cytochrome c oxidase subunit 2
MRIWTSVCFTSVFLAAAVTALPTAARNSDDAAVKSIDISAKKYEFTPSEIHVKAGERVRLTVHSVDETHGVKLTLYPEGTKDKTIVGLKFDHPEENGKVDKGVDQVLEFVAEKPGSYQFECAKVCGMHHGKMKGELVVE